MRAKLERGSMDRRHAHRYLTKVIQSQQEQRDLERAEDELLHLCRVQGESWTRSEEQDHLHLLAENLSPAHLACALAEKAAHGGIPVAAAFWREKLLALLSDAHHLVRDVATHLIRLDEAPAQNRLSLIDLITAHQAGVA